MEPTVKEGDLLLIDHRQNQVVEDAIYVLRLDDRLIAKLGHFLQRRGLLL